MPKKRCKHKSAIVLVVGKVNLYRCQICSIVYSDKYKNGFDARKIYNNYYRSYKNEITGRFLFGIEYIIKSLRLFRAIKIRSIAPQAKSVLDIGSGRGFMLYYLGKYFGYKRTVGTQIEENSYRFSKDHLGLEIYNKDLLDLSFKPRSFDLITMWHILEHVQDPEAYVAKLREILKKEGQLIIEVPNYNSWTSTLVGKYWLGLDLDYHLYFFTPDSLSSLLIKNKFRIQRVHTFSLEYSAFTSAQSILNYVTKTQNVFFNWIQYGGFSSQLIFHIPLFIVLLPLCFLINILLYSSKRGEIILIIAKK